ncbi:MAG: hypothetical protein JWM27_2744 [Gemmatimonadetes bacterium]|nr:hypothetical protein [Gemmatimonadota bacterium]
MRDMDLFESSELSPDQASRVIGGLGGTPKIVDTGVTDTVVTWIEGVICRPFAQPDSADPINPPY